MRILLTGSKGFIGSHLEQRLAKEHEIHGAPRERIDWRAPDLNCLPTRDFDLLISAVFRSPSAGSNALAENETMARNISRAALLLRIPRVLLISSGSVYSESPSAVSERSPLIEATAVSSGPLPAQSMAYPLSSLKVEQEFAATKIPLTIARLFYPYGPGQSRERLIPRLAARILRHEPVLLRPGAGLEGPAINPVYVSDAVEAIAQLVPQPAQGPVNIAGPDRCTLRELAEKVARRLGKSCRCEPDPGLPASGDLFASTEKLKILTGFSASISLEEGLQLALKDFTL